MSWVQNCTCVEERVAWSLVDGVKSKECKYHLGDKSRDPRLMPSKLDIIAILTPPTFYSALYLRS